MSVASGGFQGGVAFAVKAAEGGAVDSNFIFSRW